MWQHEQQWRDYLNCAWHTISSLKGHCCCTMKIHKLTWCSFNERDEPYQPPDDQWDMEMVAGCQSQKRSWCQQWLPFCHINPETEAEEKWTWQVKTTAVWCTKAKGTKSKEDLHPPTEEQVLSTGRCWQSSSYHPKICLIIHFDDKRMKICEITTVLCKSNANNNRRISRFVLAIYHWYISETSHGLPNVKTINYRDLGTIFAISCRDIVLARLCCNDILESKTIYHHDISLQRSSL